MITKGAEPFFLRGGSTGVLLIHGFTGLPAELLLLGEFLNRAGFTVLCVRLAGHGTAEKDLFRTTQRDWYHSVVDGFSILGGACEKIFVVGHSMGGLLTLKLASEFEVDKIVTIAAPIFIDDELGIENLPPREMCGNLSIVQPRKKLADVPPAANQVYKETPLTSVHELLDLMEDVKKILPRVAAPILILHAKDDHTAQPRSAEFIEKNIGSKIVCRKMIPAGGHLLPLTESREIVFNDILEFFTAQDF